MTNKEFTRIKRELKPFQRLFLTVACLGLLSSCGGSGSGGSADVATVQDATKQIAAVSGGTVPAGWVGRKTLPELQAPNEANIIEVDGTLVAGDALLATYDTKNEAVVQKFLQNHGWAITAKSLDRVQITIGKSTSEKLKAAKETIINSGLFSYVGFDYIYSLGGFSNPDPSVSDASKYWNYDSIGVRSAWDIVASASTGYSVRVGIADAGFTTQNIDDLTLYSAFGRSSWADCDTWKRAFSSKLEGDCNHGYHVAGVVGATGNDGVGHVGIGSGSTNLAKIYAANSNSSGARVNGFGQLMDAGVRIINYSMWMGTTITYGMKVASDDLVNKARISAKGSSDDLQNSLEQYFTTMAAAGKSVPDTLFVQISGNAGDAVMSDGSHANSELAGLLNTFLIESKSSPIYEYVKQRVIIVGAYDRLGKIASLTQLPASIEGKSRFILAPGVDIYSNTRNGIESKSGTSMAAPHVSGVAALILEVNNSLSAKDVADIILDTANTNLGTPYKDRKDGDGSDGYRYLNAEAAVKEALARKGRVTILSDDFNGTILDPSKWSTLPLGYQPGNIASFSVSGGSLHISTNGGSNGYLGIADGGRIRPKGVVLDGDFTIVADITEIMRGYNGFANRSCAMLWMHDAAADVNSASSQKAMLSICGDSTNGGVPDRSILGWSGDSVAFQDPLTAGKYYQVEMRIRRSSGKIYLGYRMAGSSTWKEVASTGTPVAMSLVPEIIIWSGDGGGTRVNGSFAADINSVVITSP